MALADTATLAVLLKLDNQMSGGLTNAVGDLGKFDAKLRSVASGGLTNVKNAAGHAAGQLKNLAMMGGIGAGIVGVGSITGLFEQGISKA